jgi:rhamnosyltransferase subunit B
MQLETGDRRRQTGMGRSSDAPMSLSSRRIVFTTFGTFGDLHPYIAIALGLKARGHRVTLATSECYRRKIGALGLDFRPLRPDSAAWETGAEAVRRFMDLRTGTINFVKEEVMPVLRQTFEDTLVATANADLVVSAPATAISTRLVAEKTGIRWASSMHTPVAFLSAYDPSVLPLFPDLSKNLRFLGPGFWGLLLRLLKRSTCFLAKPWDQFRSEIGLPRAEDDNPLFDSHSPSLVLALFSKLLADKQPDWPLQTVVTGFPIYDQDGDPALPARLAAFLDNGLPPIVFTLGTSATMVAGRFYHHSIAASKLVGRKVILVTGRNSRDLPSSLPDGMIAVDYVPFSNLFPRAAAIVHHGGVGTTALAMHAGHPMLIVPFAHDNPDNAERASRLGIARVVSRRGYSPGHVATELRRLLDDPSYAERASTVGAQVRAENGVKSACDALEGMLRGLQRQDLKCGGTSLVAA